MNPHVVFHFSRNAAENTVNYACRGTVSPDSFIRGVRERALALDLRFADGKSDWLPCICLVSWQFYHSLELLLKFTGDVVMLVLIRGSNLGPLVNRSVNLPHGIQRHRIMWVREMDKAEAKKVGESGPTIDKIEVAEFESQRELREWLRKTVQVLVGLQAHTR